MLLFWMASNHWRVIAVFVFALSTVGSTLDGMS